MLKIKDNVDLKELEKFGFKYTENKCSMGDFSNYKKLIGGNIVLIIGVRGGLMLTDITEKDSNMTYIFSDGLDVMFDLIQAGLVEKVEGE